jgi:uncharacterized protein (TIGR00725 family)
VAQRYIAVCGGDPCGEDDAAAAEAAGRLIGEAGAILVCGGGGGVMEAASLGASAVGGTVVGILPTADRSYANPYVTVSIPTGMSETRNVLIVRSADALIAIGGEFGTLSEIAFALKIGVPVVGLGTWELAKAGRPINAFPRASTPEEAVEMALRLAGSRT